MAKTYLSTGDTNFLIANTDEMVFGQSGMESVFIRSGVSDITMDQNTERIAFEGAVGSFTYQQAGNQLLLFSNGIKTATIPIQNDGTELIFSDGSVNALLTLGVMTLGGTVVSSVEKEILPDTIDYATRSSGADSRINKAFTFLDPGDVNYQILNTGTSIFANSGTESFVIVSTVSGITADQNAERIDLIGNIADFTYQQAGNQLLVFSNGIKTATVPIRNDGTQLVFSEGSVNALLTLGVMTLGNAAVSSTAGDVVPTAIDRSTIAGDGTTPPSFQTISADKGTMDVAATLNASGGAFNFTDDATVLNRVIITNFTSDDMITVSSAEASDYFFTNDGIDVIITYSNNSIVNEITLTGVVTANDLVIDEASFESAIGFNAFT